MCRTSCERFLLHQYALGMILEASTWGQNAESKMQPCTKSKTKEIYCIVFVAITAEEKNFYECGKLTRNINYIFVCHRLCWATCCTGLVQHKHLEHSGEYCISYMHAYFQLLMDHKFIFSV